MDQSLEVESREDEDQHVKLQESIELLLAAGYFRARIKGLSPFDKVVGGMTWCIELCNIDIDIDLLFQESLTIGQKIALTEKIVAVLPRMKCPHRIEPHQIQGLDFIHIFPVVQWLVKKAMETRQEMGDCVRSYSISQFNRTHPALEESNFEESTNKVMSLLSQLRESYLPKRQYRHHAPHKIKDEESRVQTTLLEFGRRYGLYMSSVKDEKPQSAGRTGNTDVTDHEVIQEEQHIQTLLSSMSAMDEHETKLTASTVSSIVGMQSTEILQIVSDYADKQSELTIEGQVLLGGIQHHKRLVASLTKQVTAKKTELIEFQKDVTSVNSQYETAQGRLKDLECHHTQIVEEMQKFDSMENDENKSILQKLLSFMTMNENLKRQEQEFKTHCKEELRRLQNQIEEVKLSRDEGKSEDQEHSHLIGKQHEMDKEKLQRIRGILARKNREIAVLQRKIDEVPSRAELSQYQRRFVELYNQVAAKHKETKQFYTLYNTLDDTRMCLSKEVSILNSIVDTFTEAMTCPYKREQFLTQFEQIVDNIQKNKIKLEKKKQEEKMRRDQLHDQHLDLVEKQRLYFKTVKDFKEECRKNEILMAKLKERGQ